MSGGSTIPRRRLALAILLSLLFLVQQALPAFAGNQNTPTLNATVAPSEAERPYALWAAEPDLTAVEFGLLSDEVDPQGMWVQTFLLTIKSGGTLADVSELLYGSAAHVDELFSLIKKEMPELRAPGLIPANLRVRLALDPRVAFVPESMTRDVGRAATIYSYYNGAKRIVYDREQAGNHKGLSAIVELPADRPTKSFTILEDFVPREVPAGVRIAYYQYEPSDDLKMVVAEIYGTDSFAAVRDFLTQTNWDPNRWPPPQREMNQRLVVPLKSDFADSTFRPLDLSASGPAARQFEEQLAQRAQAGIYPVARQAFGIVYHVLGREFNLTARGVSGLLYGNEDQYLAIAAHAGFGTLYDLLQSQPQDVNLFGRAFDVMVNYEDEQFVARQVYNEQARKYSTLLANGTLIEVWDLPRDTSGLLRQITLPSGYRKLLYRPHSATMLAAEIAYSVVALGRSSDNPQVRQQQVGAFVARFIWDYGRSTPKRDGESLDYGEVLARVDPDGETQDRLLLFATRPSGNDAVGTLPFYRPWLDSPFAVGAIAVVLFFVVFGAFGWLARRV